MGVRGAGKDMTNDEAAVLTVADALGGGGLTHTVPARMILEIFGIDPKMPVETIKRWLAIGERVENDNRQP